MQLAENLAQSAISANIGNVTAMKTQNMQTATVLESAQDKYDRTATRLAKSQDELDRTTFEMTGLKLVNADVQEILLQVVGAFTGGSLILILV